jgi:ribosomal protein S3
MQINAPFLKWLFKVKYKSATHNKLKAYFTSFYRNHFVPTFDYNNFRITKCCFYNYPSHLLIEIHSLSPGMIIGPRGEHMEALTEYMQKRISKPVKLKLEETNPFN